MTEPYSFPVLGEDAQEQLPPGFSPIGPTTDQLPQVNLDVRVCDSIVVDNQTLVLPARMAMTSIPVRVNETLSAGSDAELYVFEIFVDNATLFNVLKNVDLPVRMADIGLTITGNKMEARISSEGSLWYEITGTYVPYVDSPSISVSSRWIHLSEGKAASWGQYNKTYVLKNFLDAVVLTAHQGVLSALRPSSIAVGVGFSTESADRGYVTFGHL